VINLKTATAFGLTSGAGEGRRADPLTIPRDKAISGR
jgi:hypothetical protein